MASGLAMIEALMQLNYSPRAVIEQLERINAHPLFARADRLRRFLRHAVHRTLDGQPDTLKESLLGQEVFDRGSRFDPKADPIVRIDARRLRNRLAKYYEGPGAADAVRITLDPGSYVPRFVGSPAPREKMVAVLPFRSDPPDRETEALAEELNEAVTEGLAKTTGLRLISRHTVLQWPATGTGFACYGVDLVVNGSVRIVAGQVLVSLDGVETATERAAWSREIRGNVTGWFAIQEEVRDAVVGAYRASDGPWKRPRIAPANRSAYQSFLRGKQELAKGSPDALPAAERHFQTAVAEDPTVAGAWAGLAEIYSARGLFLNQSRAAMIAESLRCAHQALSFDPEQPDALLALGRIQALDDFDLRGALATFTRVLDAHEEHVRARLHRAVYCLAARGDLEAAEGEIESAIEIDPLSLEAQFALGQVIYFQRRFDEAIQIFRTLIELAPSFAPAYFFLAMACLSGGRLSDLAAAHSQQLAHIPYPLVPEWGMALRHHLTGDTAEALAVLDRMEAMATAGAEAPTVLADACMRLGRLDRAVEWLERAWDIRNFRMLHLRVDPTFDPLRQQASFQRLVERLQV